MNIKIIIISNTVILLLIIKSPFIVCVKILKKLHIIYWVIKLKEIIKNYVSNLTIDDVYNFIHKSNYHIKDEDINVIYKYLKDYCDDILDENPEIFSKFHNEVCEETYNEVMKLCQKYKKYI